MTDTYMDRRWSSTHELGSRLQVYPCLTHLLHTNRISLIQHLFFALHLLQAGRASAGTPSNSLPGLVMGNGGTFSMSLVRFPATVCTGLRAVSLSSCGTSMLLATYLGGERGSDGWICTKDSAAPAHPRRKCVLI